MARRASRASAPCSRAKACGCEDAVALIRGINISGHNIVPMETLHALAGVRSGRDRFAARGKEIYLYCPDGFGASKLAAAHERVLRVAATVRDWNTVLKLEEMTRE